MQHLYLQSFMMACHVVSMVVLRLFAGAVQNCLDHKIWIIFLGRSFRPCAGTKGSSKVLVQNFVKDPDAWSAAVTVHGDAIFRIVNLDLSTAMQMECLFPAAPTSACRQILTSCAIVWEAAMTLIGYCAGLVMVKPLQRTPKNSCNVKQAFHALVRAVKVQGKHPVAANGISALSHAREEYRAAVKKHKHDVQTFRAQRYMQLCTQNATLAEIFLAKCLRKNKPGLPDIMMDVAGSRLERAAVLDKAATYIEDMQELTPTADLPHRALVESQCLETRSFLRTSVDRSPAAFVLDEDVMKKALHQLDVAAECRGLPYAALLVQSPMHFQWIWLMHRLAIILGITTGLWTKQDLHHSLKPGRSPQDLQSYRVIGLSSAHGRLQEELICQLEPNLWEHTGSFQEGRSQCLIVVAADLCVAALRAARQLPFGICFVIERKPLTPNGGHLCSSSLRTACQSPGYGVLLMTCSLLHD